MIFYILLSIFGFFTVFGLIKAKSDEYIIFSDLVDKKDIPTKDFVHMGVYWHDKLRLSKFFKGELKGKFDTYEYKLKTNISNFYDQKHTLFYLKVYHGQKYAIFFFLNTFTLFIASLLNYQESVDDAQTISFIGFLLSIFLVYALDKKLTDKILEKKELIQLDFPDFANKLILLLDTGSVMYNSWKIIAYESDKDTPLYQELRKVVEDIEGGKPELIAYEDMASRCRIREISRFISTITMNLNRGGDLTESMKEQANECWQLRKVTARRLGEKASTKLTMPLGLMLLGILLITATPAMLMMSGV